MMEFELNSGFKGNTLFKQLLKQLLKQQTIGEISA